MENVPKRIGTVIAEYHSFYIIALTDYTTYLGHKTHNSSELDLMDQVEFDLDGSYAVNARIIYRPHNARLHRLLDVLVDAPTLVEYKLEELVLKILKDEPLKLKIVGSRKFNGGIRVICEE